MSENCLLRHVTICGNVNGGREPVCSKCQFRNLDEETQQAYLARWQVTQSLIPEGLDDISDSEFCVFCEGEQKNKPVKYAQYSMGHAEPASKKPKYFGFGETKAEVGSMVMLSIPICSQCRRKMFWGSKSSADLDIIKRMRDLGWFFIEADGYKSPTGKAVFSRRKLHFKYEARNNG